MLAGSLHTFLEDIGDKRWINRLNDHVSRSGPYLERVIRWLYHHISWIIVDKAVFFSTVVPAALQRDGYRSADCNLDVATGIIGTIELVEFIDDVLIFQAMESYRSVDETDGPECLCKNDEGFFFDVIISRLIHLVKIEGKQESSVAFWSWV